MATDDDSAKKLRLILGGAKPSTSKPKRAPPKPQPGVIHIDGNGNVVGDGNTINHGPIPRPKVIAQPKPGVEHITDTQAAALLALVNEIVEISTLLKSRPTKHQGLWLALNAAMGVPSYRLIPAHKFQDAKTWLERQRAILRGMKSAPKKLVGFRGSVIGAIHARAREFEGGDERRKAYMLKKFQTDTMTECSDSQVEMIRKHVFGWKRK